MNNIIDLLKSIKSPQDFVNNYAKQNNSPILSNLIDMAQKNDIQGLEGFARNFFKEQGRDFDKEYSQLKNIFK